MSETPPTAGGGERLPRYFTVVQDWPVLGRLVVDRRFRYMVVGGVAAVVYFALFSVGWLMFSRWIPYPALVVVTNFLTAAVTFPLYRHGVFEWHGPWLPGFLRFYATCLWALAFALVGLSLLVEVAGVHVLLANAIIIVLGPVINYQIHRFWAFRRRH